MSTDILVQEDPSQQLRVCWIHKIPALATVRLDRIADVGLQRSHRYGRGLGLGWVLATAEGGRYGAVEGRGSGSVIERNPAKEKHLGDG